MPKPTLTVVLPGSTPIDPPRPLGEAGRALWNAIQREFAVEDAAGVELLMQAALASDRVEALAKQITQDGEIIRSKTGPRAHPALKDEVALRSFICRTLERLGVNAEPIRARPGRPSGSGAI